MTSDANLGLRSPMISRLCLVPARQTGVVSLCVQLVGVVISGTLTVLLLLHLDNTQQFDATESDISFLSSNDEQVSIWIILSFFNDTKLIATNFIYPPLQIKPDDELYGLMNVTQNASEKTFLENDYNETELFGPRFELVELLRISTVTYIGIFCFILLNAFDQMI